MMKRKMATMVIAGLVIFCTGVQSGAAVDAGGFEDVEAISAGFKDTLVKMHEAGRPVSSADINKEVENAPSGAAVRYRQPAGHAQSAVSIYSNACQSIVSIASAYHCPQCHKWHMSTASGFVVGTNGVIMTNYHVLGEDDDNSIIAVRTFDGRVVPIKRVLAADEKSDCALFQVDLQDLKPLPIAATAPVGTPVLCISHPVGQWYTLTEGIVAGNVIHNNGRYERAITADYAKGSSGAPILDYSGAVVGMVRVTSPVYYKYHHGVGERLQMVWKYVIPSEILIDMMSAPVAAAKDSADK